VPGEAVCYRPEMGQRDLFYEGLERTGVNVELYKALEDEAGLRDQASLAPRLARALPGVDDTDALDLAAHIAEAWPAIEREGIGTAFEGQSANLLYHHVIQWAENIHGLRDPGDGLTLAPAAGSLAAWFSVSRTTAYRWLQECDGDASRAWDRGLLLDRRRRYLQYAQAIGYSRDGARKLWQRHGIAEKDRVFPRLSAMPLPRRRRPSVAKL
jgi:hypothetical protein